MSRDAELKVLDQKDWSSEGNACIGRRPAGLRGQRAAGPNPNAAYWGSVAHLEAASVHAFATLARELAHHGAPPELIRAARRSMKDEARHAAITRFLSRRYGGSAPRPCVERRSVRSLEAIAIENAVEGCIGEAFGALVGAWQARFARDPAVRLVMRSVAGDELRHATLAWAIDAWLQSRLSRPARGRVDRARRAAVGELRRAPGWRPDAELVRWSGLPDARSRAELVRRFAEAVT